MLAVASSVALHAAATKGVTNVSLPSKTTSPPWNLCLGTGVPYVSSPPENSSPVNPQKIYCYFICGARAVSPVCDSYNHAKLFSWSCCGNPPVASPNRFCIADCTCSGAGFRVLGWNYWVQVDPLLHARTAGSIARNCELAVFSPCILSRAVATGCMTSNHSPRNFISRSTGCGSFRRSITTLMLLPTSLMRFKRLRPRVSPRPNQTFHREVFSLYFITTSSCMPDDPQNM